jgi:hypothetical protein
MRRPEDIALSQTLTNPAMRPRNDIDRVPARQSHADPRRQVCIGLVPRHHNQQIDIGMFRRLSVRIRADGGFGLGSGGGT